MYVKILKRIINRARLAVTAAAAAGVLRFHAHNELAAASRREREGERAGRRSGGDGTTVNGTRTEIQLPPPVVSPVGPLDERFSTALPPMHSTLRHPAVRLVSPNDILSRSYIT